MCSAPALGVAHLSANVRRALNGDLERPEFERNLDRYLSSFSCLVQEEWGSFKELQSFTTGHNLQIMFADRSPEMQMIAAASKDTTEDDPSFRDKLDHVMSLMRKSGHYCMPCLQQSNPNVTQYMCFQLLGFRPSNKKYMQRLTNWGTNRWRGQFACAVLGSFSVDNPCVCLEDGEKVEPPTVDAARVVRSQTCSVQTIPLESFLGTTT